MIDLAIDNRVFVTSKMQEAIQELDVIFSTEIGEMIGYPSFGANWHQFLHTLTPMESSLKQYINTLLVDTYYCRMMNVEIEVEYVPGEITCSYIVYISIEDPTAPENTEDRKQNKIYQIR